MFLTTREEHCLLIAESCYSFISHIGERYHFGVADLCFSCTIFSSMSTVALLIHWDMRPQRELFKQCIIAIGRNLIITSDVCCRSVQKFAASRDRDVLLCQLSCPLNNIKHSLSWNVPSPAGCQTGLDTSLSLASHLMSLFPCQRCYPKPSLETDTRAP